MTDPNYWGAGPGWTAPPRQTAYDWPIYDEYGNPIGQAPVDNPTYNAEKNWGSFHTPNDPSFYYPPIDLQGSLPPVDQDKYDWYDYLDSTGEPYYPPATPGDYPFSQGQMYAGDASEQTNPTYPPQGSSSYWPSPPALWDLFGTGPEVKR
jgi:hypothetical protein